jgi:3-carboxy-cis,cis-muconate cycloisomerase
MLGRTLLQAAPPITFGLKAAGWLGSIRRSHARLSSAFGEALILQFGGATGTLASLGQHGIAVGRELAKELELGFPDAPWHTHRDRLAALICACGVLTGTLGKMARDISLLMQNEVGEASEPGGPGRGGSSTMPHKRNPSGCVVALAAANHVPGLVASFLSSMVHEHERAVGAWQAEWPTVAALMQATGAAVSSMREVAEGLSVDEARMRANIEATRGVIFAERAMMLLGEKVGRDAAHKLLDGATRQSVTQGRRLHEVLSEMTEVSRHLDAATLRSIEVPEEYLGSAETFRKRLLSASDNEEE